MQEPVNTPVETITGYPIQYAWQNLVELIPISGAKKIFYKTVSFGACQATNAFNKNKFMMKTVFTTLLATLIFGITFSQTEKTDHREISGRFEKYYNAQQFDSIYLLFSAQTQNTMPLEKTKIVLTKLKTNYGKIEKITFKKYQTNYALYTTTFERGILTVNISIDSNKFINGLFFKPYEEDDLSKKTERNAAKMNLPFNGEWTIFWGGDTRALNQHVGVKFQKNAFDIVITDSAGKTFKSDGRTNEDYYAFGQPIIATCDGEIVLAVDGVKDNKPGNLNSMYVPGNSILLKTKDNEYILFAHFKQFSIKVKQGDKIKRGQFLGFCGNSGNSSEPHLHFHIQNIEDINNATGVKCYFENIDVNGILKTDYSPVKGDKVKNEIK